MTTPLNVPMADGTSGGNASDRTGVDIVVLRGCLLCERWRFDTFLTKCDSFKALVPILD